MLHRLVLASATLSLTCALTLSAQQTPSSAPPAPDTTLKAPGDSNVPPLTLEQCVIMALDKNFDLNIQRINTAASVNSLESAKAEYDPNLSANINQSYTRSPSSTSANGVSSNQSIDGGVGVAQKVITGATLQVGYSGSWTNPRNVKDYYGSGLSLSVKQPLLKNFGTIVNRANIDFAKLSVERSNYDLKGQVLTTIRSVETAYYNLAYLRSALEVRKFSLEVAQKLLDENRVRRSTGVATEIDVLQAEVGVATAQRDLVVAQKNVSDGEDSLLALINPFQFDVAIGPLALTDVGPIDVSFDHSYKLARDNTPELASARLGIKQYEIDVAVTKQNKRPSLDLGASAGYAASRDTFGSAFSNTVNDDNHNWAVGATLSYPWGLRRERAAYAQAKASLNAAQVSLERLDQQVLVQVRTAIRGVEASDEGVRITTLATRLSEKQYDLEKARNDNGLSTFRRVQEAKEDLDNARIAELSARVSLRNALAELARLETSSLDHYKVKLTE